MDSGSVSNLLIEAGSLMLIGMLFVFAFLGLLIVGVHLIAKFCEAFPGESVQELKPQPRRVVQPGVDGSVIAAITAAVHTHRQANKK